jgi:hypothetical protein
VSIAGLTPLQWPESWFQAKETNVEVLERDARSTGSPPSSFDLVTSRLVLVNIPRPEQVVSEAVALAKPGGWVAFHEADWVCHLCDPPLGAWTALVDLFLRYSERNGVDPYIGRRVPRLLRDAGITTSRSTPSFLCTQPVMVGAASCSNLPRISAIASWTITWW